MMRLHDTVNTLLLLAILGTTLFGHVGRRQRFQALGDDEDAALDTLTGRVCLTYKSDDKPNPLLGPDNFPYCWDIK